MSPKFVCINCHHLLTSLSKTVRCPQCKSSYPIIQGIPSFVTPHQLSGQLRAAQQGYDQLHQKPWDHLTDGSYEIFAAFARGNKTLDVACGDGFIEELAPHTVGLDFSLPALLKAKKRGAQTLVHATAEDLPFGDNSFDLVICSGSLEHFSDPQRALSEMARTSKIQILTVHRAFPLPFGKVLVPLTQIFLKMAHQPIETPFTMKDLDRMYHKAGLNIIFKGVWTLPVNYGRVVSFLPELTHIPSCHFVISRKK